MQQHRADGIAASAYHLVPVRWRAELYTAEGQAMVTEAWRAWRRTYGLGLPGVLLLALSAH
jgi:hypothetical protein